MMSASEFFDGGLDPPWLVDACEGEFVSPVADFELSVQDPYSLATYHDVSRGTEAGPSNSAMHMDLDEEIRPSVPLVHYPRQELERPVDQYLQDVSMGIQSERPSVPSLSESRNPWLMTTTASIPNRMQPRKFPSAPAADHFFRACKKRKRSYL